MVFIFKKLNHVERFCPIRHIKFCQRQLIRSLSVTEREYRSEKKNPLFYTEISVVIPLSKSAFVCAVKNLMQ